MSFPLYRLRPLAAAMVVVATFGACQQRSQPAEDREMDWARAALERNPAIEVVSADDAARRFTVRIRASGELATVALGTIVAGPPESFSRAAAPEAEPAPAAPEASAAAADAGAGAAGEPAGAAAPAAPPEEPAEAPAGSAIAAPAYTVERSAGGVRVTGPGVSIETVGPAAAVTTPGTMRADSPVICEGPRLLRLDGRRLAVSGDAIVARDGCEIHLTNSRVDASRSGIVVRDARVHVSNSDVRGLARSLDIYDGGEVYARSSEFTGLVQRHGSGRLDDLGGNRFD